MAKKEEPIANDETGKIKVKAKTKKQPDGSETKGNVTKVKANMKKPAEVIEQTVTKVDLDKPPTPEENETKKDNTNNEGVVTELKNADTTEKQEEVPTKAETQEAPVLEELNKDEKVEEVAKETNKAIKENIETSKPLPENIQKLVDFMSETGGDIGDYVALNTSYDDMDSQDLLLEYYKNTKPHLNAEEINFLMEDQFSYDEDLDEEKDIKRKKLALKEQVANAKNHLDGLKSKYYEDIKNGSKLTKEQQNAIDFFNRYNEEELERKQTLDKNTSTFLNKTDQVFNDKFKGFEYNIGDKKFRMNVNDADKVKETQSDINNFIKKFLNENESMEDAAGYHKSLYTAMNADTIANHFYEQGKADALKESISNAKNVNMDARQSHGEVSAGGMKVKVLGENSDNFKFKIKNNKFKK
tara:strand:- start:86 stop:1327 length:1242 start_codon:yes stop_codon:yes gene_type:complete